MKRGTIQIAGIKSQGEALMLARAGVDWLGFPLKPAYHPEDIDEKEAARITARLPEDVHGVVITYLEKATDILALCRRVSVSRVQLHGEPPAAEARKLKEKAPDLFVIKSLVVTKENTDALILQVETFSPWVDAFLTDTFDPLTGARGATGKIHDWRVSRRLVELSPKPVLIAGGLTPENVGGFIRNVRPHGVDAHTGVEDASGFKSEPLVRRFIEETRRAFEDVGSGAR